MRYIGNKTKMLSEIESLLSGIGLLDKNLVFADAFTGTGVVANHFKTRFKKIIANDNLYFSSLLAEAKINNFTGDMGFESLGFDPFEYFNNQKHVTLNSGFIYKNYCPKGGRNFFSNSNGKKIDFIRQKCDEWHLEGKITDYEYKYLIACLIESVSFVANVAGVYGAALSNWDPRALKDMKLRNIEQIGSNKLSLVYNEDILTFLSKVKGDVLYLDPPYTKNSYATQYHLLETIAKYDSPIIAGKGGIRDMGSYSSDFSKEHGAGVIFNETIKAANFKHIVVSYSSDGILSSSFIESVLKRYGKPSTYKLVKIPYSKYTNSKTNAKDEVFEYLFYIEKSELQIYYASPLNYIGGKYDMIDFIVSNVPTKIDTFYDLFGGGMSVSINSNAKSIIYNDLNFKVKELFEYFRSNNMKDTLSRISNIIKKYKLEKNSIKPYNALRSKYNYSVESKRNLMELYVLILFGFQQQIRFNSKYEFNNPVGQAHYNEKVKEKLISFVSELKRKNIVLFSEDYTFFKKYIKKGDFVYIDPPYLVTLGSYNDGKRGFNGWDAKQEKELLIFIDYLDSMGVKFMLSNVLTHKNIENSILKEWLSTKRYYTIKYEGNSAKGRDEVIIVNYQI